MKTKYSCAALLTIGLLGAAGCSHKLDIAPVQSIDQSAALSTADGVKATLTGAYATLGSRETTGLLGGQTYVYADLLAYTNEITWSGTYQGLTQLNNKQITVDNNFVTNLWLTGYQVVNQTNNVLASLNVLSAADKARVEGEAKFIRGTVFFELIKLYAKAYNDGDPAANPGIPLVTTPTIIVDPSSNVARSTVAQTYAQIIKDLTDAESLMPQTNGFYATKYTAAAMLSRVYLMQGNYPAAAAAANRVIASGKYQLVADVTNEYPGTTQQPVSNTSEDIYAQQMNTQSGANVVNEYYGSSSYGGRGDIQVESATLSLFEPTDTRRTLFFDDAGSTRTLKYQNQYANVPILRLAEMYLTLAEANLRTGVTTGMDALTAVNTVRTRAGIAPLTRAQLTVDAVLQERTRELLFEGQQLHDLKRTKRNIGSIPWNSPRLIFPIPQREIQSNPALTQNEGY